MSDLMLMDKYSEEVSNRDWGACHLISNEVEPLINKINRLKEILNTVTYGYYACVENNNVFTTEQHKEILREAMRHIVNPGDLDE